MTGFPFPPVNHSTPRDPNDATTLRVKTRRTLVVRYTSGGSTLARAQASARVMADTGTPLPRSACRVTLVTPLAASGCGLGKRWRADGRSRTSVVDHTLELSGSPTRCWTAVTQGLSRAGQRELVISIMNREGWAFPAGVFHYLVTVGRLAGQWRFAGPGAITAFQPPGPLGFGAFLGGAYSPATGDHHIPVPPDALQVVLLRSHWVRPRPRNSLRIWRLSTMPLWCPNLTPPLRPPWCGRPASESRERSQAIRSGRRSSRRVSWRSSPDSRHKTTFGCERMGGRS